MAYKAYPAFHEVGIASLILSDQWRPVIYDTEPLFGLRNMLLATLLVSAIACVFALLIGVGCALFLACGVSDRTRSILMPFIDLLAGIPSVVYGFIGLYIVVAGFEKLGQSSGESVLAGSIVLSVMILPYIISSTTHTMTKIHSRVYPSAISLGTSTWYIASELILPAAKKGILVSCGLALGRAMGETMAVMMVMGNAPIFPTLLGKGETIASLLALEMGTAEVASLHFSSLFAAGFLLLAVLLVVNLIFIYAHTKLNEVD